MNGSRKAVKAQMIEDKELLEVAFTQKKPPESSFFCFTNG